MSSSCWSRITSQVSLEDVFQKTKISKTSVYRILKTLVHRGYVAQTQNGLYRLVSRPRRLRFGFAAQSAEMPFSQAVAQSVTAAAAAAGVELLLLDNRYDPDVAIQNAEEFVAKRVDLALEFQVEEAVAPRVAHIFKKADIPLVAIDVPHPNSTYFGVDNFEVGFEAGSLLAQYALRKWKGKVDWVLGVGFCRGRQLRPEPHHRRIRRNSRAPDRNSRRPLPADRRPRHARAQPTGGRRVPAEPSPRASISWSPRATDSSALGVLDAARAAGREEDFAIVGQDCIPEVIAEMRSGKSAIIGSISHEAETYGPRLIQIGICAPARLRRTALQLRPPSRRHPGVPAHRSCRMNKNL